MPDAEPELLPDELVLVPVLDPDDAVPEPEFDEVEVVPLPFAVVVVPEEVVVGAVELAI